MVNMITTSEGLSVEVVESGNGVLRVTAAIVRCHVGLSRLSRSRPQQQAAGI